MVSGAPKISPGTRRPPSPSLTRSNPPPSSRLAPRRDRLTEVVYTISPMKVGVMGGLFKDWGNVMGKKVWGWKDVGGASVPYCIFSDSVTPHPPFPSFVLLDENTAAAAAAVQLPAVRPMRACDPRADVSVLSSHGCGLRPRRSLSGGEPEVTQLQYYCSVPKKVGKGKHEACVRVENPRCCSLRHLSCHRHLPVHRGLQREAEAGAPLLIGAPD